MSDVALAAMQELDRIRTAYGIDDDIDIVDELDDRLNRVEDPNFVAWQDGDVWCAKLGASGQPARGKTRDEAIYFAGWWEGRRELGESVARHVAGGGDADEECGRG